VVYTAFRSASQKACWSAVETRAALTYAAIWVIALAAWQAGRPDLISSAHPASYWPLSWEGVEL
jgi:hypothetical protein